MKDILKMIRFDFVSVRSLTLPYVMGFIILSFLLALFGIPLGVFCVAALLAIFGPVQELANSDTRKIYGILPVSGAAVTRAAFLELILPLFAGEMLSFVFLFISRASKLYRIFPGSIGDIIGSLFDLSQSDRGISYEGLCAILMAVSVYLCILAAFLEMAARIYGHESNMRNLMTAIFTVAVPAVVIVLIIKGIIPPVWSQVLAWPVWRKGLLFLGLHIIATGLGALFCEIAVKKTADFEI